MVEVTKCFYSDIVFVINEGINTFPIIIHSDHTTAQTIFILAHKIINYSILHIIPGAV